MQRVKDFTSNLTKSLTDSGEPSTPHSTVAREYQSVGIPEPYPSDVQQGRRQTHSAPPSHYISTESSRHRGRGEEASQMARPPATDSANPNLNEGRHSSTIQRMERDIARLRRGRDEKTQEAEHRHRQAMRYKSERNTLRTEAKLSQRELDNARTHEEALVREITQLKALLETRRQELQDAQRFMGTVDTFAESEVVQEVRGLNTEIFNLAHLIADQASPDQGRDTKLSAEDDVICVLGRPFLDVLESTDTRGDTILLEIATQVAATNFLARIISTWTNDSESDNTLTSVYERIRNSENQSVAGQWRALTRKFAQAKHIDAEQLDDSCSGELTKLLWHVLLSSGMRPSAESDPQHSIQALVSKALKIRHLIGEAMKSSEYEIQLPRPGVAFVAEEMDDVFCPRGKGKRTGSSVSCCTGLGLRRVEKVEGRLRSATLVKPGVGLQTLVEDLCLADGDDERMSG